MPGSAGSSPLGSGSGGPPGAAARGACAGRARRAQSAASSMPTPGFTSCRQWSWQRARHLPAAPAAAAEPPPPPPDSSVGRGARSGGSSSDSGSDDGAPVGGPALLWWSGSPYALCMPATVAFCGLALPWNGWTRAALGFAFLFALSSALAGLAISLPGLGALYVQQLPSLPARLPLTRRVGPHPAQCCAGVRGTLPPLPWGWLDAMFFIAAPFVASWLAQNVVGAFQGGEGSRLQSAAGSCARAAALAASLRHCLLSFASPPYFQLRVGLGEGWAGPCGRILGTGVGVSSLACCLAPACALGCLHSLLGAWPAPRHVTATPAIPTPAPTGPYHSHPSSTGPQLSFLGPAGHGGCDAARPGASALARLLLQRPRVCRGLPARPGGGGAGGGRGGSRV